MRFSERRFVWSVLVVLIYLLLTPQSASGHPAAMSDRQYHLLAIPFLIIAAAPWFPRRFSLRALLITTTLVAVGLGIAAYVARL